MHANVHKTVARIAHHHRDGAISHAAMELNPAGDILTLRASQHLHLPRAEGWMVRAIAGAVWIAQDGDIRDVVLEAGDCIVLDRDVPALFSPLGDARISLSRDTCRSAKGREAVAYPVAAQAAFA
ncbi:DUF2917 domain-containing protein [Noviherbaspirillum denitrificans]|nr:DUF2917 domain-containing protein [Noviherbaspirillum denitrificans]